jgi:hypothetical protein
MTGPISGILQPLCVLSAVLFLLTGCVDSGSDRAGSASGSSRITLQVRIAEPLSSTLARATSPGQTHQALDPDVISRLRVEVSAEDIPETIVAEVNDITSDEVEVEVLVSVGDARRTVATAFNGFDVEICRYCRCPI